MRDRNTRSRPVSRVSGSNTGPGIRLWVDTCDLAGVSGGTRSAISEISTHFVPRLPAGDTAAAGGFRGLEALRSKRPVQEKPAYESRADVIITHFGPIWGFFRCCRRENRPRATRNRGRCASPSFCFIDLGPHRPDQLVQQIHPFPSFALAPGQQILDFLKLTQRRTRRRRLAPRARRGHHHRLSRGNG